MLIDTHAHLNFNAFSKDRHKIIKKSLADKIWMINVGSNYHTSQKAVCLAEKYKAGVYAAVGLHPIHAQEGFDYKKYKELAAIKKVKAIGETGLDYKEEYFSFRQKQAEVFLQQMTLAQEMCLPLIFHCRRAHDAMLAIIKQELEKNKTNIRGVVHCFTGKWPQAEQYLKMGFYLGFNGIIFKLNLDQIIKKTPLNRILIETDCPYLTPSPAVGRNEPAYVRYVMQRIARLKGISEIKTAGQTRLNAKKLFKI